MSAGSNLSKLFLFWILSIYQICPFSFKGFDFEFFCVVYTVFYNGFVIFWQTDMKTKYSKM